LKSRFGSNTTELVAANARLKQEMEDKEAAQTELNRQSERIVRELTENSKKASQLRQMRELMQSCTNMEEAVSIVLGFAPKIFQQLRGALILLTPSKTHLEVAGSWSNCELPNSSYDANACWAIRTGHLHAVDAGDPSAPCAHAKGMKNAYFCVPILAQGETIGIIHFQATGANKSWFEYQLTLASTFTEQVGLSISNIRLRELLKNQSIKDPLTGVFNRRYLGEFLERETRRVTRAKQSLGVIMLDLDHFKKFNDTYGHGAGDKVLQELGLTLVKSVRAEDVVCRYGGEEFIILLPGADDGATRARAEQIRSKVRELTVSWEGKPLGVLTISPGIAGFPEHGSPAQVVAAADAALYHAKRSGRDRVMVAQSAESVASAESAEEQVSNPQVRV